MDVRRAPNLRLVGQLGGAGGGLASYRQYTLVGIGPRVVVLDLTDPSRPVVRGQSGPLSGQINDIAILEDRAFVASSYGGLRILGLSDATRPVELGAYDRYPPASDQDSSRVNASGVVARDARVYLADSRRGLCIFDVADPTQPALLGSYEAPYYATTLRVDGTRVYVVDSETGLHIVDVSDPVRPVGLGVFEKLDVSFALELTGHYAYVADDDRLLVLDVSDSERPVVVAANPGKAFSIAISGQYAFVLDYEGIRVLDISDPCAPRTVGRYATEAWQESVHLMLAGERLYASTWQHGLRIFDRSNPLTLVELGAYETLQRANRLAVADTHAYVACGERGLAIVDVSDPTTPILAGREEGQAYQIAVAPPYAYVAAAEDGVRILDVHEPTRPIAVGRYLRPGSDDLSVEVPQSVTLRDRIAFVKAWTMRTIPGGGYQAGEGRLEIVDVADPISPSLIDCYDAESVGLTWLDGRYLYLTAVVRRNEDLQVVHEVHILDTTNPRQPTRICRYQVPGTVLAMLVHEGYLYLIMVGTDFRSRELRVVSVVDVTQPVEVGSYSLPQARELGVVGAIAKLGGVLFLSVLPYGMRLLDVSDPRHPEEIGKLDELGGAWGMVAGEGRLYIAHEGLYVFDVD